MAANITETYLLNQARPLERELYRFHYAGGSRDEVLRELAKFQNADGGFGSGLEPDIQSKASSVLVTTIAFQRLREIAAPAEHPVVVQACAYLRDNYDAAALDWPSINARVHDAPHAPWWSDSGVHSLANPRAEIIGYLYDYAIHFSDDLRDALTQAAFNHVLPAPDDMEMHDALCYLRLYHTAGIAEGFKTALFTKLARIFKTIVATDPAAWQGYGLQPLAVVNSPQSPFAPLFQDAIPANLDLVLAQRTPAGDWSPAWSWADVSADGWAQAERDWRSVITLDNFKTLRAFGRL